MPGTTTTTSAGDAASDASRAADKCPAPQFNKGQFTMAAERNKPNDYRNWSLAALNAAIMYEIENCRCTQALDHLLAARGKRTR